MIRDIAQQALIRHRDMRTVCLEKNLRNSHRICQFLKANMGIKHAVEIQAIRNLPEDGIFLFHIIKHTTTETFECPQQQGSNPEDDIYEDSGEEFQHKTNKEELVHNMPIHINDIDHIGNAIRNYNGHATSGPARNTRVTAAGFMRASSDSESTPDTPIRASIRTLNSDDGVGRTQSLINRMEEVLAGNRYQEQDIVVLSEDDADKKWAQDTLQSANHPVQESSSFPVQHIVVDTLAHFEGLESPVILFIVPEN